MFNFTRFDELRAEKGVTKKFLAEKLERHSTIFQDWKHRKSTPSASQLKIIARELDTTPEYLMGESDDKHPPAKPVYVRPAMEEGKTLMAVRRIINDLSEEDLQKVAEYVEFLKSLGDK